MAKKYSKYVVTRDKQIIFDDLKIFVQEFNGNNILNFGNINSWHLYEMIQKMFFCNWPNTNFRKYFVKAEPCILNSGNNITQTSCNSNPDNYFGYLFINSDSKTNFKFIVDNNKENIVAETGLLLISPSNYETHSIEWNQSYPLIMVKFSIIPLESIKEPSDWTPL